MSPDDRLLAATDRREGVGLELGPGATCSLREHDGSERLSASDCQPVARAARRKDRARQLTTKSCNARQSSCGTFSGRRLSTQRKSLSDFDGMRCGQLSLQASSHRTPTCDRAAASSTRGRQHVHSIHPRCSRSQRTLHIALNAQPDSRITDSLRPAAVKWPAPP
ncbi:hypothetical protein BIW11_03690 [Tropilaelaps mercedesae]|uniref:Uncharacterized protein n=1 Tax=Tropilaelaps mercedesae TaxID=418985 RepID=A0A1V9XHA0_9ACAR|nr:hypothetical protein BIW11_03690 [Tropilaelaps mercedesae]